MNDPTPPSPDSPQPPSAEEARLSDLLDDRLPAVEAEALRARLETEPALRALWDDLQRVGDWTRGYGDATAALEPPPDFAESIRQRTTASGSATQAGAVSPATSTPSARGRLLRILAVSYAAAALVVVGFTVLWVFNQDDQAPEAVTTADGVLPEETLTARLRVTAEKEAASAEEVTRLLRLEELEGRARIKDESSAEENVADAEKSKARDRVQAEEDKLSGRRGEQPAVGARFGLPGGGIVPGLRKARDADEGAANPTPSPVPHAGDSVEEAPSDAVPPSGVPSVGEPSGQTPSEPAGNGMGGARQGRRSSGRRPAAPPPVSAPAGAAARAAPPSNAAAALRKQLATAERAGERVFVIEARDLRAGLREARRLLDSAQLPPLRGSSNSEELDAGGKAKKKKSADDAKRGGGAPPASGSAPAREATRTRLRFYAVDPSAPDQAGLLSGTLLPGSPGSGTFARLPDGRPSADGLGANRAPSVFEYVGSIGRQVSGPALQRLQALARKGLPATRPGATPAAGAAERDGGTAGDWRRERPAADTPTPPSRSAPTSPAPTASGPAPEARGPTPASERAAVRILVLRRK